MRLLLVMLVGVVALAGVFGACGDSEEEIAPAPTTPDASPAGTPTQAPATTPTASPVVATPAPSGAVKYVDPTYGYSFEYPADWFLSSPKDNGGRDTILYSYNPAVSNGRPVSADKLKAFFWVAEGVDKSLADWLAGGDESPGQISPPVVLSQSETVLGGKQGLARLTESDGVKSLSYYIPIAGARIFVVNAVPADSTLWSRFEAVLGSINFEP